MNREGCSNTNKRKTVGLNCLLALNITHLGSNACYNPLTENPEEGKKEILHEEFEGRYQSREWLKNNEGTNN